MKHKLIISSLFIATAILLVSCSKGTETTTTSSSTTESSTKEPEENYKYTDDSTYENKELNIYRKKGVVDKKFPVRFYTKTPNIPYVNIIDFYKEFFGEEYDLTKDNFMYTLSYDKNNYMKYDIRDDVFYSIGINYFSSTDYFISSTGKTFLSAPEAKATPMTERIVDLKKYNIDIHGDDNLYVPLTFISTLSGGIELYNVAYNTKDIYVIDWNNVLNNKDAEGNPEEHNVAYYGTDYTDPVYDTTVKRPKDLIEYNYGQLCFDFDILRGNTSQLLFGDNALISYGLDGVLEAHYPKIKEYLLSENKEDYFLGYKLLMVGLYDGGHTGVVMTPSGLGPNINTLGKEYVDLVDDYYERVTTKTVGQAAKQKKQALGFEMDAKTGFYYKYDDTTKTALIGFDTFACDYDAWDEFYKNNKTEADAPVDTDTYAYVRKCLYQAKTDGADNVVFDLSSNGGGNVGTCYGLVGLLNKGRVTGVNNETFNKYRGSESYLVDVNLDGKYDEADIAETEKFDFNYAVITTSFAFSCGNLFPSMLKEIGVKVVGQRSGGGSCTISISSTPDGMVFVRSNNLNLTNQKGENIDSGVPLDYEISVVDGSGNWDLSGLYTFNFQEYFNQLSQQ